MHFWNASLRVHRSRDLKFNTNLMLSFKVIQFFFILSWEAWPPPTRIQWTNMVFSRGKDISTIILSWQSIHSIFIRKIRLLLFIVPLKFLNYFVWSSSLNRLINWRDMKIHLANSHFPSSLFEASRPKKVMELFERFINCSA